MARRSGLGDGAADDVFAQIGAREVVEFIGAEAFGRERLALVERVEQVREVFQPVGDQMRDNPFALQTR